MAGLTRRRLSRGGIGMAIALSLTLFSLNGLTQTLRPEAAARGVYERAVDLPLQNQYIRLDTGELDPENTLVSRFIRYHQDAKKRFTVLRLDWQLTLADYLGVNEAIVEERYPGNNTLTVNPMTADIQAIRSLNRRQREQLVTILVHIYNPESVLTLPPSPSPVPSPVSSPRTPALSKPGDADLLKF
jgi:hypothetical protein